jgi:hypothetical protein
MSISLNKATPRNPGLIEYLRKNWKAPVNITLVSLDQEVTHHFDNFAPRKEELRCQLEKFKARLSSNEPKELVNLVEEPLVNDVTSEEAEHIVMDWLLYNPLPNYFLPVRVIDDPDPEHWHLPIGLLDREKKKGLRNVGEVLIDKKTGKVVNHPPIETLWNEALTEVPVEALPDNEVLALANLKLGPDQQAILSNLLAKNREDKLNTEGHSQLDEVMHLYEQALLHKSEALRIAVQRGLRPRLES